MANITLGQQCRGKKRLLDHPVQAAKLRLLKKGIGRKCYSRKKVCSEAVRKMKPKGTPSTTASSRTSSDKDLEKDSNNNTVNCGSIKEDFLSAESLLNEFQEGARVRVLVKEKADYGKTYERLMLSLQSPLPNEHEFAINICMVLSAEETKELNVIAREPALLNMLLAHVGFYLDCGLRMLMEETFREAMGKDFASFWEDIILPGKQNLLCECYPRSSCTNSEVEKGIMIELDKDRGEAEDLKCCAGCRYYKREDNFCDDNDFKSLPQSYYCPCDKVGKRVEQVSQVLRNFSFDQGNAKVMANSETMIRFLLSTVYSDFSNIPQIGFDIISNISGFLNPNQEGDSELDKLISELFELILTTVMKSNDRFKIIRSLEALQLSMKRVENWDKLLDMMDQQLYQRIIDLLTLSADTILVINCVECILGITGMGTDACEAIVSIHGCVEILVAYITGDFSGCSSEGFKFTVLQTKEPQKDARMEVSQQNQYVTMKEKSLKVLVPLSDFYMFNERSIIPTVVPLEPFTVHPINQRYYMVQRVVAAMAKKMPGDNLAEHITNAKNGLSGNYAMRHGILPSCNGSAAATSKSNVEPAFSLQIGNGNQNNVTLSRTAPIGTKKLLSDDELDNVIPYLCEWGDCKLRFLEKKQLRWHFYKKHCPNPKNGFLEKMRCQWRGNKSSTSTSCQSPRSIFSLMKHLEEFHYSDTALETALHKRRNKMEPSDTIVAASNTSKDVYLVHKAFKQVYSTPAAPTEIISEKEDDVTKSTRLTAALALRNLAKDSLDARRSLKRYESHFVEVATRGLECSATISQLLYYLNE